MLELLAAFVKLSLYAGCLAGAGTALAAASLGRQLGDVVKLAAVIVRWAAAIALLASIANILVLIFRLGGDFSEPTLTAILESPPAPAAALQIAGALVLLTFASGGGAMFGLLSLLGAGLLAASFAVNGHAPSVDLLSGFTAGLHVAAAAWWLGALLLLGPACTRLGGADLAALVQVFSRFAMAVVALLVVAGGILILTLVNFGAEDWFTPYAQVLTLKVVLAATVLSLAIYNKVRLTPQLDDASGPGRFLLRQSIAFETLVIAGVLTATALLTTFTSPHT